MHILIIPNLEKEHTSEYTFRACHELLRMGAEVLMEEKFRAIFPIEGVLYRDFDSALIASDILLPIGGDGTILHSAKRGMLHDKLTLGINAGRLGFLAQIEQNEFDKLRLLMKGEYQVEHRMVLEISVQSKEGTRVFYALNDATVTNGSQAKMIDIDVKCEEKLVSGYRANGLVFATPTGSTAYSLSAGGPVVDPKLSCILMTPICPHTLFSRCIAFADDKVLSVHQNPSGPDRVLLSVDGETDILLEPEDVVVVKKAERCAKFISFSDKNFYEILNQKIMGRTR
ncbi:NAD(+)/NADH kinase [Zongyangia hominis]|uniref:NAD kinase n=1 Tax=Zongyangia hominis TaxID=2763677 RepID=A0A926E9C1_9FIRM|nr:NAD(+)/NADH kinase [Zongyangia hominis]MBC8569593.1 NAD(+)/NADH kinase [Zongyangia hominis]